MVNGQDFLDAVDEINYGDNEVMIRICISRIYYGIYHLSKDWAIQSLGYAQRDNLSVHQQLIKFYQNHPDINSRKVASILKKLKKKRVKSDYLVSDSVNSRELVEVNLWAKQVLTLLQ